VGGGEAKISLKSNSQGLASDEFENSILERDGLQILGRRWQKPLIEKTWYEIWWDSEMGYHEFGSENQGLIVAEVETDQPPQEISKPDWVGQALTGDPRCFTVNLVRQPYSQWRQLVGG
jgi:CYTH domain-containing protein